MKDIENPMYRKLTLEEEMQIMGMIPMDYPECSHCGEPVYEKYKKQNIHKDCYFIGKADYERDKRK